MLGMVPMTGVSEASGAGAANLYGTLQGLGLTTNLKLCLDAGALASYTSGQKWLDLSGNGYDFFRGATASAEATDPTFNGTAGNLSSSEYFSTDGGDYFTYDSTIETWMQTISKSGGVGSILAVVYVPTDVDSEIVGTDGNLGNERGIELSYFSSFDRFRVRYSDTTDAFTFFGAAGPDVSASIPGLFIVGVSFTLTLSAGYVIHVNGTNASGTLGGSPSASNPSNSMKILARGDASSTAQSAARIYALSMWQGTALSAANFTSIYDAIRARFGV